MPSLLLWTKNPPPFVTARASAKPAEQTVGGSKLGRGGETSATSAVSVTWESGGGKRVFSTHPLSCALKAQSQLLPLSLLRAQGRKAHIPMRPASCSWILSISMGVVTITWQVPAPQPASISFSSVSGFLPKEKRDRVHHRRWPGITLGQLGTVLGAHL